MHGVAPLVGAWIEIYDAEQREKEMTVAPLVGAWIEMIHELILVPVGTGRSPCGSVD